MRLEKEEDGREEGSYSTILFILFPFPFFLPFMVVFLLIIMF